MTPSADAQTTEVPTDQSRLRTPGGLIDVHTHFLPDSYFAGLEAAGIGVPDNIPGLPSWSVESALEAMDALGVACSILSISSPGITMPDAGATIDLARAVNDAGAAAMSAAPGRFGLFASLPVPDMEASVAELERALDELGADGVTLLTNVDGCYVADARMAPVLAALNERSAVVFLHPSGPPNSAAVSFGRPIPMLEFPFDTTRAVVDLILSGTIERYPAIRWIVPHAGACLPVLASRVEFVLELLRTDGYGIDVAAALRRFYYDLAGPCNPILLPALVALAGTDHLLYGSDTPFTSTSAAIKLADDLADADVLANARERGTLRTAAEGLFPRLEAR